MAKGSATALIDPQDFRGHCLACWWRARWPSETLICAKASKDLGGLNDIELIILSMGSLPDAAHAIETELRLVQRRDTQVPVLALCETIEPTTGQSLFSLGLTGLVSTLVCPDQVAWAIDQVRAGGNFVPNDLASQDRADAQPDWPTARHHVLTPREEQVARLLQAGRPNKLIAFELGISEGTVKTFVRRILQKLDCHNRTEAAQVLSCSQSEQFEPETPLVRQFRVNFRAGSKSRAASEWAAIGER